MVQSHLQSLQRMPRVQLRELRGSGPVAPGAPPHFRGVGLSDTDPSVANVLRRIIISHVPTIAVRAEAIPPYPALHPRICARNKGQLHITVQCDAMGLCRHATYQCCGRKARSFKGMRHSLHRVCKVGSEVLNMDRSSLCR